METTVVRTYIDDLTTPLGAPEYTDGKRVSVMDRALLPPAIQGLGGGRSRVVAAGTLTSWLDVLGPGATESAALHTLSAAL